ncbi:hypothetical protein ON010_g15464 [Phytophthora cinnamomi]|nr:hypothetical protein ON010_g15464 [Phytophthora cinnamomi]
MFVELAEMGYVHSVGYLYNQDRNDPETIGKAFVGAARHDQIDVLKLLLVTGGVASGAFDKRFEIVARCGHTEVVLLLYSKKRATAPSLRRAFEGAGSVGKFLYRKGKFPADSIVAAFQNAPREGHRGYYLGEEKRIPILKFLCATKRIPAELIVETFSSVKWNPRVIAALSDRQCIPTEMMNEIFNTRVVNYTNDEQGLVKGA